MGIPLLFCLFTFLLLKKIVPLYAELKRRKCVSGLKNALKREIGKNSPIEK